MAYAIDTTDRRRRRALRAVTPLAALLIAALLVWQGSTAAFSASTNNTNDTWATGSLLLTNNGGNAGAGAYQLSTAGLFAESNLKPGNTGFKCLTVKSDGSLPGSLRLYRGAVSGTNGTSLAAWVNLTITAAPVTADVTSTCAGFPGASTSLYTGTLAGMPDTYAAANSMTLNGGANERVAYRIAWTVGDAPNSVQSSTAIATLTWEVN